MKFGTDGVRGVALTELTTAFTAALGRAAVEVLEVDGVVVGRDTRRSGPELEAALASGLEAAGARVGSLGVVPTPAVAHVAAADLVAGAMISASHNPWSDNGIKLFAPGGRKLTDAQEAAMEQALAPFLEGEDEPPAVGDLAEEAAVSAEGWVDSVAGSVAPGALDGLRVIADCANGSAVGWAPRILRALGASVEVMHDRPDGTNINEACGSTYPAGLQQAVLDRGADLGLAFDGDADRVVAVDHTGALVDGDHIIAVCAIDRHERGALVDDTVVVTVMANLGFRLAMDEADITTVETPVGDRHVLAELFEHGWSLGGEQSGHVIFPDHATTGDGLLTAVQLLDVVVRTGRPLADLAAASMTQLPQVLENVRVDERRPEVAELLAGEISAAETKLGDRGRVLIRPSGTEPLIRVMVEAESEEQAAAVAAGLVAAVEALPRS